MLGSIVVRFLNIILNIVGIMAMYAGAYWGGRSASELGMNVFLGTGIGFIASFLIVVVTLGLSFLAIEINNNLVRIQSILQIKLENTIPPQ